MLSPPSYPCEPTPPISVLSIELALAPAPQPPAFSALLSDGIPPPNAVTLLKTELLPLASDAPPAPTVTVRTVPAANVGVVAAATPLPCVSLELK